MSRNETQIVQKKEELINYSTRERDEWKIPVYTGEEENDMRRCRGDERRH
jgi:hypothetical protein